MLLFSSRDFLSGYMFHLHCAALNVSPLDMSLLNVGALIMFALNVEGSTSIKTALKVPLNVKTVVKLTLLPTEVVLNIKKRSLYRMLELRGNFPILRLSVRCVEVLMLLRIQRFSDFSFQINRNYWSGDILERVA